MNNATRSTYIMDRLPKELPSEKNADIPIILADDATKEQYTQFFNANLHLIQKNTIPLCIETLQYYEINKEQLGKMAKIAKEAIGNNLELRNAAIRMVLTAEDPFKNPKNSFTSPEILVSMKLIENIIAKIEEHKIVINTQKPIVKSNVKKKTWVNPNPWRGGSRFGRFALDFGLCLISFLPAIICVVGVVGGIITLAFGPELLQMSTVVCETAMLWFMMNLYEL